MQSSSHLEPLAYDVVIIGAGINGAGIARDAARRGLRTLLVDKGDFCSGATSWSTRLVHGGLRYLEYFEFSLVRESLKEREILLNIAPHLVDPLLLTIPIYRDRSRPYWKVQAGMRLYDLLSYDKTLPNHRMLPRSVFHQLYRSVDTEKLAGGAQYYDAQVAYAERLALENILDAEAAGAIVMNYTEVTALHREGDRISGLTCRDLRQQSTFRVEITPQGTVLNIAGAWVDEVLHRGQRQGEEEMIGKEPMIGPTKGSHIVVPPFPGAPEDCAFYVEAKSDGRPFFIVPWLGLILIGTTDIKFSGNLDEIKAADSEIDYLIEETNQIFPLAQLSRDQICFTYSGVRPLPYAEGKKPSSITRSHVLHRHVSDQARNLISLIGGKITTYRQVGEEAVNAVFKQMGRQAPPCTTDKTPLPGTMPPEDRRLPSWLQAYRDRLDPGIINALAQIYGARTGDLLSLVDASPDLAAPLLEGHPFIAAQVVFAVQTEYAYSLVDILLRRTLIAIYGDYGIPLLPRVLQILQIHCGWSREQGDRQIRDYCHYMFTHCIPEYERARYEGEIKEIQKTLAESSPRECVQS
ncbi:glycerol-3-phosphate dehydrogenase [Lyngbya confervoides]|uniref:Glycerol-3-phosphate dehydrogenase n=1 Tax=Lyngbya confervoides BDU141951 TaxID=1574623 RepID=A0ABD4T4C2_9CYAN|nr:glycerol-3-phosphate dehydrogenase [Lyngbya confervoides]MCM1983435.1 glycerol-3-phosphate dehydrogenase [Lyngbya confervoides BDU141951]